MPITDFLDNVPPTPPGHIPYRPPSTAPGYQPPVVYPPSGNGAAAADQPAGQFPPIPDNIFGFFMLMLGL